MPISLSYRWRFKNGRKGWTEKKSFLIINRVYTLLKQVVNYSFLLQAKYIWTLPGKSKRIAFDRTSKSILAMVKGNHEILLRPSSDK